MYSLTHFFCVVRFRVRFCVYMSFWPSGKYPITRTVYFGCYLIPFSSFKWVISWLLHSLSIDWFGILDDTQNYVVSDNFIGGKTAATSLNLWRAFKQWLGILCWWRRCFYHLICKPRLRIKYIVMGGRSGAEFYMYTIIAQTFFASSNIKLHQEFLFINAVNAHLYPHCI